MTADEFDLTLEQAAFLFQGYIMAVTRMEVAGIEDKRPSDAIPRSILSCGDALLLIPAGLVLVAKLYPQLMDTEVLMAALRMGSRPGTAIN